MFDPPTVAATQVDWTQVMLATITMIGSVTSGLFAYLSVQRSNRSMRDAKKSSYHALLAKQSADVAIKASGRPDLKYPAIPQFPHLDDDDDGEGFG